MIARRRRSLAALIAGCAAASGCGDPPPVYPLRLVMVEAETARQEVERELGRPTGPEGLAAAAERIERWMSDPALDRALERGDLRGDPARFRALRGEFDAALEGFLSAARAGDAAAARETYPDVQAACNGCHAVFRPELGMSVPR